MIFIRLAAAGVLLVLFSIASGAVSAQEIPPLPSANKGDEELRDRSTLEQVQELARKIRQKRFEDTMSQRGSSDLEKQAESLKEKIRLFKERVREQAQRDRRTMNTQNPSANDAKQLENLDLDQMGNRTGAAKQASSVTTTDDPGLANSTIPKPPSAEADLLIPEEFSTPVDAYELANSLYLSGSLEAATKQFEEIKNQNPQEFKRNQWAQLMLANCYRVQGSVEKAKSFYREINRSKSLFVKELGIKNPIDEQNKLPGFLTASSWYLNHLEKLQSLQTKYAELEQIADAMLTQGEDDE